MKLCLVPGTHDATVDDAGRWWQWPSPWTHMILSLGHDVVDRERPFVWSGDLNGVFGESSDWKSAGYNLFAYLVPPRCPDRRVPPEETVVISHSHGVNVALYAAAYGLKIAKLIDICGPVREDMMSVALTARPNIAEWIHVRSDYTDWWQWLGAIGDGRFGVYRDHPLADRNALVPGAGHSGVIRDPAFFHHWKEWL